MAEKEKVFDSVCCNEVPLLVWVKLIVLCPKRKGYLVIATSRGEVGRDLKDSTVG